MSYVLVLYYSKHGSTSKLAQIIARGIESVSDIEARIRTVPAVQSITADKVISSSEIDAPYATYEDLENCLGLALGSPTRFGNMAAPMKYFIDGTAGLWAKGALVDKPAMLFTSTSSMHGGNETSLISMMLPLLHHGMTILGVPYTENALHKTKLGGTPYGPSAVRFNSENELSEQEQIIAFNAGARLGRIALKLV